MLYQLVGSGLPFLEIIAFILAYMIALMFSFCAHEFSHAFVAFKLGDPTARSLGRVSLNPLKHIDGLGFLCLILFGFGWAKPVPINPNNFRNVRKGEIIVSLAGVITNFILCIVFTICAALCIAYLDSGVLFFYFLQQVFYFLAATNLCFAVFNLLPLYPLDGFNLIRAFCKYDNKFIQFMYKWSFLIMLVLLLTGAFGWVLNAFTDVVIGGIFSLFGIIIV